MHIVLIALVISGYGACAFAAKGFVMPGLEQPQYTNVDRQFFAFWAAVIWPLILFYVCIGSYMEALGYSLAIRKILSQKKKAVIQLKAKEELQEVEQELNDFIARTHR